MQLVGTVVPGLNDQLEVMDKVGQGRDGTGENDGPCLLVYTEDVCGETILICINLPICK